MVRRSRRSASPRATVALTLCCITLALPLGAQARRTAAPAAAAVDTSVLARLQFRSIGPANPMGRTTDIEGVAGDPNTVYVGSAASGLWKTTNGGTTFRPLTDSLPTLAVGDFALEPNNPNVIYLGTGEGNVRNSVSFGRGVFKSTDGGATWRNVGLTDTKQIARVMVSPSDANTVYVCAVGHMGGPNAERGVFVSRDAGATWTKSLFIDDRHGCSDLDIDPANPNIVYAGMWLFDRKQWNHTSGSEQGGIFKSVDAGRTWTKMKTGLPTLIGRIGIKVAPSQPNIVYALMETQKGYVWRSDDFGTTWRMTSNNAATLCRGFYYADLRVDPVNADRVYAIACQFSFSIDGGRTFSQFSRNIHGDHHGLWIDPKDPRRMWQVNDGGIAVTVDHGATWRFPQNMTFAQFYQVHADNREPFYFLGGGLQDNGNWVGPSRTREPQGILVDDWRLVRYGDGYYQTTHPDNPELFLTDAQGGWIYKTDMRTLEQQDISPQPRRNDGGPVNGLQYRFNWNAPLVASPHDGKVVYFGAQVVFRTRDFGGTWEPISPDLTKNDTTRHGFAGGPVLKEATTAEYYNTLYSIAESPVQRGLIWAGADDGNIHVTRDDGKTWTRVDRNIAGVGVDAVVSHIEASRTAACTAYATFERHFMDDYRAYVYRTTDCGTTWTSIAGNLPDGVYLQVLREDPKNPQVLYAGTEAGLYVSISGGGSWFRVGGNLPPVPVHEVLVHSRENDLIIGTHARGIWILDDASVFQEMAKAAGSGDIHLFGMRTATRFATKTTKSGSLGDGIFRGQNPAYGAIIRYHLPTRPDSAQKVQLEVRDSTGALVRTLARIPRNAGINTASWDLAYDGPRQRRAPDPNDPNLQFFGPVPGPRVLPGTYRIRLVVGEKQVEQPVTVRLDPTVSVTPAALRDQFTLGLQLRDLQSVVNDTLRALDSRKRELEVRKAAADGIPDGAGRATAAKAAAEMAEVDALLLTLSKPAGIPQYNDGPRIADRIGALLRSVDGTNSAPTGPQKTLSTELATELRAALDAVARHLGRMGITM
jgi:photosystem II stability/assembly factor-like uncharacterized protein